MKKVYLSGGTVGDWRDEVMEGVPDAVYYNPKDFEIESIPYIGSRIYAPMDRLKIMESDIVFGYLEATNPTPINVVAEMCYGKGIGKITLLCNEWTFKNYKDGVLDTLNVEGEGKATWFKPHYLDLVCQWMDFVETDFGVAIQILRYLVG